MAKRIGRYKKVDALLAEGPITVTPSELAELLGLSEDVALSTVKAFGTKHKKVVTHVKAFNEDGTVTLARTDKYIEVYPPKAETAPATE